MKGVPGQQREGLSRSAAAASSSAWSPAAARHHRRAGPSSTPPSERRSRRRHPATRSPRETALQHPAKCRIVFDQHQPRGDRPALDQRLGHRAGARPKSRSPVPRVWDRHSSPWCARAPVPDGMTAPVDSGFSIQERMNRTSSSKRSVLLFDKRIRVRSFSRSAGETCNGTVAHVGTRTFRHMDNRV